MLQIRETHSSQAFAKLLQDPQIQEKSSVYAGPDDLRDTVVMTASFWIRLAAQWNGHVPVAGFPTPETERGKP
jgi:hypothetical protein